MKITGNKDIRLRIHVGRIACILLCSFIVSFASAQTVTGRLAGRINDGVTGEKLYGASVSVKGTKYGTASQQDGTFLISLPVGTYTLTISMNGYASQDITGVEIKKSETNTIPIVMTPASKSIDTVRVTYSVRRATQAALYNLQKRASGAQDVISVEAIVRTPDTHVGQIGKRITGVSVQDNRFVVVRGLAEQYNQTILNGVPMTSTETDRNSFALDLIPAVVVDNIVVNKTATPDMP
ncbi:MAG: carboxypeptidase-like regulatory domain-containing protein, partial [Chitinophagaceae bacterium]|nr:carboxypeptidase-like regulatory domain-containing protein [Chitinophagaceae bacterium]